MTTETIPQEDMTNTALKSAPETNEDLQQFQLRLPALKAKYKTWKATAEALGCTDGYLYTLQKGIAKGTGKKFAQILEKMQAIFAEQEKNAADAMSIGTKDAIKEEWF